MFANLVPQNTGDLMQVASVAGHTLAPAWAWASSFLILIILTLALVIFARYAGKGPYVAAVASLYVAYALYAAFPYLRFLPTAPAVTALAARLALYLAFFVIGFLILKRIAASDFIHIGTFGLLIVSFLASGFIMTLAYQSFPVQTVYHFSPALDRLFAAKEWFFWWFAAPLAGLFFLAQ